jgi:hypothetical protein
MPELVKMAFERQVVVLPLSNILPIKRVPDTIKQAMRYKRIVASITEIGIVEPLVVARRRDMSVGTGGGRPPPVTRWVVPRGVPLSRSSSLSGSST